ncbi:hypothetical protein ANCCAN_00857 [Ancylostoma caninum]|uniref:Uncharacterized protein n=1 Tax=Ancylostoma caninum TaxID=29170 RepID=A0A368H8F0_ANCCA|nr:hypothetical protein ANCCAN_00857 [Ancylostoma caninum]
MKRKLLQQMAKHLSETVGGKRTAKQVDQKIRDEIRQVKKYFRYERNYVLGTAAYSKKIRLSACQQFIVHNLRGKLRLSGFSNNPESRPTKAFPNDFGTDCTSGSPSTEYYASPMLSADASSSAERNSLSLEAYLCGLGDHHRAEAHDINRTEFLNELQREAFQAEIECSRARAQAASEERRYWEERRNLQALERRLLQQSGTDGELSRGRYDAACTERRDVAY